MCDHQNFNDYRLYTLVVTYDQDNAQEREAQKEKRLMARAYLRYCDGNGKIRVFYNNYDHDRNYGTA